MIIYGYFNNIYKVVKYCKVLRSFIAWFKDWFSKFENLLNNNKKY